MYLSVSKLTLSSTLYDHNNHAVLFVSSLKVTSVGCYSKLFYMHYLI